MKLKILFSHRMFLVFLITMGSFSLASAQKTEKPTSVGKLRFVKEVSSIRQLQAEHKLKLADQNKKQKEANPKKRYGNNVVPGKGLPKDGDPLYSKEELPTPRKSYTPQPVTVFDADVSQEIPSDPTGAAGKDHYVAAWNSGFKIFDKNGNALTEEISLGTLFEDNTAGDPIVFFDAPAGRFVITQFEDEEEGEAFDNGLNIAICKGDDPLNDGWYVYTAGFETPLFPDYPKYAVWHDGYYVTCNIGTTNSYSGDAVFALERDKMLLGEDARILAFPLPGIVKNGFYSPHFFNVGYPEMPSNGPATVTYFQDDSWSGVARDHLKLWNVSVDWQDTENSFITEPIVLDESAFPFQSVFDGGSFENLPQPTGRDIDALQGTVMNQAQFRAFSGYNSAVFNFVVDVAGGQEELAGIRWYELRQTASGEPWSVFQRGTYVSPLGLNTFAGSMVMDKNGAIGLGYSTVGETAFIDIKYTGRYINDPIGVMTVPETVIGRSNTANPSDRYADYSHMTLDPVDEETFWFITEYFDDRQKDVVGVFKLAPTVENDVHVIDIVSPKEGSLTTTEEITILIRNNGDAVQGNFPVTFQIDEGDIFTETFTGSLAFNETAGYTFSQTADLSEAGVNYTISASTQLPGDQNPENDLEISTVESLFGKDVGFTVLVAPEDSSELTGSETIIAKVTNFGGEPQANFPVSYQVDDLPVVTEIFSSTIRPGDTQNYSFQQTVDFSSTQVYDLVLSTQLPGDSKPENDMLITQVENQYCQPLGSCIFEDGVVYVEFNELAFNVACSASGFTYFEDVFFQLDLQDDPVSGSLRVLVPETDYAIFIDFDEDGNFDQDELVSQGQVAQAATDTPFFLDLPSDAVLGTYRMRIRGRDSNFANEEITDPCEDIRYGTTTDFNVTIFDSLENVDIPLSESRLEITKDQDRILMIDLLTTETKEPMKIQLFNTVGQKLVENWVENERGHYRYQLDLSYVASGVYIIKMANDAGAKVRKVLIN
ncbi:MAG: GEVED domain-containing protein [Leeuwenhoekiella sp.]